MTPLEFLTHDARRGASSPTSSTPSKQPSEPCLSATFDDDEQKKALADAILLAGRKRRGEIRDIEGLGSTAAGRLALKILHAAARARGEVP